MNKILRRWVLFGAPVAILVTGGLFPLGRTWAGDAGAPTTGRLYVLGEFGGSGPLLRLERAPGAECYTVLRGRSRAGLLCGRSTVRVWVDDALLELSGGARGVPHVSVAGARLAPDAVIGSGADAFDRGAPRVPLRGYGIPYRAATVSTGCAGPDTVGRGAVVACIRVHDGLGRLAIARSGPAIRNDDPSLREGRDYPLYRGDHLWLGMVPYAADTATVGGTPGLALVRVGRAVPDEAAPGQTGKGGDRRWLGRLWPVDIPDAADSVPSVFEVFPSRQRYFRGHLSRQRTNYESEDLLQRLVDGQWLCLDGVGGESPRVEWRPLERPGCLVPAAGFLPTREQVRDYRRARSGLLVVQIRRFLSATNEQLAAGDFLDAPSALPLAFAWELRRSDPARAGYRGLSPVQPYPRHLWGVRFGSTLRTMRRRAAGVPLPDLYLRTGTATHLVEVAVPGRKPFTLYLTGGVAGDTSAAGGEICLNPAASPGQVLPGSHHPLGAVLIGRDAATVGAWSGARGSPCGGCTLTVKARRDGRSGFRVAREGNCETLAGGTPPGVLQHGDSLVWNRGSAVLRFLRRGEHAWVARADARDGERYYAHEFYQTGGLVPLLGDPAGISGVEAAVREFADEATDSLLSQSAELTVDGDLQIEAASAVARIAAKYGVESARGEPARITAVVLDAGTGEVLAAVNHFGAPADGGPAEQRPTAWDLGASRAHPWQNTAFLRRGAIGSAMKIVGAYALANHGLRPGPASPSRLVFEPHLSEGSRSGPGMRLARSETDAAPALRLCLNSHGLPVGDDAFTADVLVERFAKSCNNFFVLTGFRHASAPSAVLVGPHRGGAQVADSGLGMSVRPPTIVQRADEPLADRIRQGLAADAAAPGNPPRSIYGLWFRLGFQPTPVRGPLRAPTATYGFVDDGRRVEVPLGGAWFAPRPGSPAPALEPERDFAYPFVPSPGRLTEDRRTAAPVEEFYDDRREPVRTMHDDSIGRADVQYAQLLIGQGEAGVSALGLALMYAPAARRDGRVVRPCVFRAACSGADGPPVFDPRAAGAATLERALQRVVEPGGTAANAWRRAGGAGLRERWGGKTGTYQMERFTLPGDVAEELAALTEHACGVIGTGPSPRTGALAEYVGAGWDKAATRVARAGWGAGRGAWACEEGMVPFNPGGIHGFARGGEPALLDSLHQRVRDRQGRSRPLVTDYHAFVVLSTPGHGGAPARAGGAEGIVIAVLVDDQSDIAVQIGAALAQLVERWAPAARTPRRPVPGGAQWE